MKPATRILFAVLITLFIAAGTNASELPWESEVRPGIIVFKVTSEFQVDLPVEDASRFGVSHIDRFMDEVSAEKVERTFPHCFPPKPGGTDLTSIYTLYFPASLSPYDVARDMSKLPGIEFAEPRYIDRLFLDHDDPLRYRQYGLDKCQANEAHDISTGNRSVPVAIIDSGVDQDHEDLLGNRWVNPGEDLNGDGVIQNDERNDRDDDDNGKRDDFYGWDFVDGDNNPDDGYGHGTHCAGIASAVTNNRRGVASVGYSCGIMGVRAGSGGYVTHGYEGIQYAARTGAKVISCSWGGSQYHDMGQQVVNYAYEHDAMMVCAAGNNYNDRITYPAGYDHVVAVAATDRDDRKPNFSCYGDWVDIAAPGVAIHSTIPGNRYTDLSGTSMSCPFAASVAILIRATFPGLSVDEAVELLLDGADDIGDDRLGAGRINAYESLLLGARPRLMIEDLDIVFDDNQNGQMDPGELVNLAVTVSNDENGVVTEELSVVLSAEDVSIIFQINEVDFPNLEPGESFTNRDDPFIFEVAEDAIPHTVRMKIIVNAEPQGLTLERDFEILVGHPDILIVDDDDGEDFESWYYTSVEQMGMGWAHWDVAKDYSPDAGLMSDHEMVIWVTGNADPPLDELDRWQLEAALGSERRSANILLIGKRIGDYEENRGLLSEYFGAQHMEDDVDVLTVEGLSGNRPIAEDVQMLLTGVGGARNGQISPSTMAPVRGADSLVTYYSGRNMVGLAGVYYISQINDSRTVYLGFSFESVSGRAETTPRHEVLRQLYDWFTGEQDALLPDVSPPNSYALDPAYPNPFNGVISVNYSLPNRTDYRLAVTDALGRDVVLLGSGAASAGSYIAVWDATAFPSGVYFLRLTAPGLTPVQRQLTLIK